MLYEGDRFHSSSTCTYCRPGVYCVLSHCAISPDDVIIDAKSGTTGAGRAPKEAFLFCEVADGIHAYGVASHRHAPEIEQGVSDAAGRAVVLNFTPHLMPMSRGILESIYVKTAPGNSSLKTLGLQAIDAIALPSSAAPLWNLSSLNCSASAQDPPEAKEALCTSTQRRITSLEVRVLWVHKCLVALDSPLLLNTTLPRDRSLP